METMISKNNFCTIFDSNFLIQGLALYQSLESVDNNFHLYIFSPDKKCIDILISLNLKHATMIPLSEIEDETLLSIKKTRTKQEYYWTCTSIIILHIIEKYGHDACTYLDADLYFFQSPSILIQEVPATDSVLITEHRYGKDKADLLGKYCVQFNLFKNTPNGLLALNWWRDRCLEWCYARVEDGKFGDQKYLDDWTERFTGVHELNHLGGVGPWNVSHCEFYKESNQIYGKEKETNIKFPLVFYHFHHTELFLILGKIKIKSYYFINKNKVVQKLIYKPYELALQSGLNSIRKIDPKFKQGFENPVYYLSKIIQEITPKFIKRPIKNIINFL